MKVFDFVSKMLTIAPAVVAGIEAIHGEKDSVTRTQMAQDALGISSEVAQVVLPQFHGQIAVANEMIASIIAGLQKLHAASKQPAPVPAAT